MTAALADAWELSSTKPLSVQDFASAFPRGELASNFSSNGNEIWNFAGSEKSPDPLRDFVEILTIINEEAPETLAHVLQGLKPANIANMAFLCYLQGDQDDLCTRLLSHVNDRGILTEGCECIKDKIQILKARHTESLFPIEDFYEAMDLNDRFTRLTSAYLLHKIRQAPKDTAGFEDYMRLPLRLAVRYGLTEEALLYFNQTCPIPQGLIKAHEIGTSAFRQRLAQDKETSQKIIDDLHRFMDMNWEEKLSFARQIVKILSEAYGIFPPPKISDFDQCPVSEKAYHEQDISNDTLNILGIISFNKSYKWDSPSEFLTVLFHEFAHGLEDVSIWITNSIEQDQVSVAPHIRKNLLDAGLALSFNTEADPSNISQPHHKKYLLYRHGRYYPPADGYSRYRYQLRERHTFSIQTVLLQHFIEGLAGGRLRPMQDYIAEFAYKCLTQIHEELKQISLKSRTHILRDISDPINIAKDILDSKKLKKSTISEKLCTLSHVHEYLLEAHQTLLSMVGDKDDMNKLCHITRNLDDVMECLDIILNFNSDIHTPKSPKPIAATAGAAPV